MAPDIIYTAERLGFSERTRQPVLRNCERCGYICSQALCKACLLLQGLNSDTAMDALRGPRPTRDDGASTASRKPARSKIWVVAEPES